jgi:DNA ligase-1
MRRFAALYATLDATTATSAKVAAMAEYFEHAPAEDAAWAVLFLTGQKLKRVVGSALLRGLAIESSGYPDWLVDECYAHVGDLAETIALLVDARGEAEADVSLATWVERLRALPALPEDRRAALEKVPADLRPRIEPHVTRYYRVKPWRFGKQPD